MLHLSRGIAAVNWRTGRDALYVVAAPYEAIAALESRAGGQRYPLPLRLPAGFRTDLASVPRVASWYVGCVGPHLEASVVHDWHYAT